MYVLDDDGSKEKSPILMPLISLDISANIPRQVHSSHISDGTKVIFRNSKGGTHLFPIGGIGDWMSSSSSSVIGILQQVSLGSFVKSQCRSGRVNLVGQGRLFQGILFQTHVSKRRLNRGHELRNHSWHLYWSRTRRVWPMYLALLARSSRCGIIAFSSCFGWQHLDWR